MPKPLITSLHNPLIKQARSLRNKKGRQESGLFLVEGLHPVGEAVEAGWQLESLLYAPDLLTSGFGRDLVERLSSASQPVSAQVMRSLADKDNPQGILALVHQRSSGLPAPAGAEPIGRAAALVAPQDPGNVGTILRTLDAVGADALFLLDGGVELYHPGAVRASMGTMFWKPVFQSTFDELVGWARAGGYQLIGSSVRGEVVAHTFVPKAPWILVLGNEQKGLSTEQAQACDVTVSLPMQGRVSSLNLAVAAGILLHHFCTGE